MEVKKVVTQKIVDVVETSYECDICHAPYKHNTYLTTCSMCGKEVCGECLANTQDVRNYDHYDGDYPDHYCKNCWNIGKPYTKKIMDVRDKYYNDIEKLEYAWKKECEEMMTHD